MWATKIEAEIDQGTRRATAKVVKTLSDAFDEYLLKISPSKASHAWNVERVEFLRKELDFVGERIQKIEPGAIEAWRDRRLSIVKSSSVNRDLTLMSAVFQAAIDKWKWLSINPVHEIDRPDDPPSRNRRVTDEEARVMVAALGWSDGQLPVYARHFTAIAFMFAIETGMRRGEIIALTWPNAFPDQRYVHVAHSKNGDARDVPLSTRAVALLHALPRSDSDLRCFPITLSSLKHAWWEARKTAVKTMPALKDLNFHDSRHEATTRLSRKLHVLALARMIGHRDVKSLMIYYNETAAELAARLD
ncbi:tyrosine-type recombinase/integrase [Burkholderia glumae]|uniref:Site-specific integrase n=1 Tax=Burkholderia glumae TaxID=337 RepID=A0ABY5B8M7_BURGL|nr:site-specific integrase [Burkholderia glumae]USS42789.1 site-specific integrase [Burkholderia glumae]